MKTINHGSVGFHPLGPTNRAMLKSNSNFNNPKAEEETHVESKKRRTDDTTVPVQRKK